MTTARRCAADAALALSYDITAILCAEFSLEETLANHLADAITRGLRARCGGQDVYVPAPDKTTRDESIRRDFNGRNRDEVCRQYGVSPSRLYQIVSRSP